YSLAWPSTKIRPITKVTANHRRSPYTSPRSAANTPNWQVTDDSTRMTVKTSAYGISRCSVCSGHMVWPGTDARMAKYIANRAAKNISSLESQTIVPTLTMLGLVREWIRLFSIAEAAVTRSLLPVNEIAMRRGGTFAAGLPGVGRAVAPGEE